MSGLHPNERARRKRIAAMAEVWPIETTMAKLSDGISDICLFCICGNWKAEIKNYSHTSAGYGATAKEALLKAARDWADK